MSSNRRTKECERIVNHEKQPSNKADTPNAKGLSFEAGEHNMEDRLDRELAWCIEQLKLGICSKPSSSGDKQVVEAMKILRILQSSSTPLPKKRQVMRATFGDYRKKMEDELRQIDSKSRNDSKKIRVNPVSSTVQCKSTFYKKCVSSGVPAARTARLPSTNNPSDSLSTGFTNCSLFQQEPSENNGAFSFHFNNSSTENESVVEAESGDCIELKIANVMAPNSCSFSTSGSEFRFDFSE